MRTRPGAPLHVIAIPPGPICSHPILLLASSSSSSGSQLPLLNAAAVCRRAPSARRARQRPRPPGGSITRGRASPLPAQWSMAGTRCTRPRQRRGGRGRSDTDRGQAQWAEPRSPEARPGGASLAGCTTVHAHRHTRSRWRAALAARVCWLAQPRAGVLAGRHSRVLVRLAAADECSRAATCVGRRRCPAGLFHRHVGRRLPGTTPFPRPFRASCRGRALAVPPQRGR